MLLNAYEILGLQTTATEFQIKTAFRRQVRRCHPDRGGSADAFIQLRLAYEILMDSSRRISLGEYPFFQLIPMDKCQDSLGIYDRYGRLKTLAISTS